MKEKIPKKRKKSSETHFGLVTKPKLVSEDSKEKKS